MTLALPTRRYDLGGTAALEGTDRGNRLRAVVLVARLPHHSGPAWALE